jgi:hypothetical protein
MRKARKSWTLPIQAIVEGGTGVPEGVRRVDS